MHTTRYFGWRFQPWGPGAAPPPFIIIKKFLIKCTLYTHITVSWGILSGGGGAVTSCLEFAEQPIFSPTPCSDSFLHDLSITTLAITEEEVVGELAGLNSSKSSGLMEFLLHCLNVLPTSLLTAWLRVFGLSLQAGKVLFIVTANHLLL